jgi:FtsZ-binding cell division protein ZapB
MEQETSKEQKVNRVLIFIIILLSLALGITLWQFFELRKASSQKGTEIEFLNDERGELQTELEDMLHEFDSLETDNDSMKVELAGKREEIEGLLDKVKDKDYAIYKLKKETKTLRVIMRGYVVTIDSINTLNVGLRKENSQVKNTLTKERTRAKALEKTNKNLSSKVQLASRLDVSNVNAFGVQVKRDLTGKETDRARRTDKVRVCFDLEENVVAKSGNKNIYIRIMAPDGQVLAPGIGEEFKFEFNGVKGYFSDMMKVNYNNSTNNFCLDWAKPNEEYELLAGVYNIFIYAEDYEMAKLSIELK